jgi:hypothetical protein
MTKDTGISASDFVTNDGSAGRTISGVLSGGLGPHEVMQLSFDGGVTWNEVSVNGLAWSATDTSAHEAGWTVQARVINTTTHASGPISQQQVTLVLIPPAPVDSTPVIATPTITSPTSASVATAPATPIETTTSTATAPVSDSQASSRPSAADAAATTSDSPTIIEPATTNGGLYTRADGFQVIVLRQSSTASASADSNTSTKSSLLVNRGVPDVDLDNTGREIEVPIPRDAFAHTRDDAVISLTVLRSDGSPLPLWLKFDPRLGVLKGTPPTGTQDEIEVRVIARDQEGHQVEATFRIKLHAGGIETVAPHAALTPELARPVASKAGLTKQLQAAGKSGRVNERERLVKVARAHSERLKNVRGA